MQNGNTYYGYQLPGTGQWRPALLCALFVPRNKPEWPQRHLRELPDSGHNHTRSITNTAGPTRGLISGTAPGLWGLTASDIPFGYNANEPNNDVGVIAPTAALSSFRIQPHESMNTQNSFIINWEIRSGSNTVSRMPSRRRISGMPIRSWRSIGPIIVMIENHRSGLVWNLLTSCPK